MGTLANDGPWPAPQGAMQGIQDLYRIGDGIRPGVSKTDG